MRLFNGGITNLNNDNNFTLNFSETDYDLSNFSTKTVTHPKMQEINSKFIIKCFIKFLFKEFDNKENLIKVSNN